MVEESGRQLVAGGHPQPERVLQKAADLRQMWDDLRELTQARQEALSGAKQVHVFDRDADETIAWIAEKEAATSSDDYGHDLDSIQALVRRHQGFERDLAAVKEQVRRRRGRRLCPPVQGLDSGGRGKGEVSVSAGWWGGDLGWGWLLGVDATGRPGVGASGLKA